MARPYSLPAGNGTESIRLELQDSPASLGQQLIHATACLMNGSIGVRRGCRVDIRDEYSRELPAPDHIRPLTFGPTRICNADA